MSTVHPYRRLRLNAVSSLSLPFGQFNLNRPNSQSSSLFARDDADRPNTNQERNLCGSLNSKVIRDEPNEVNLCSKLKTAGKKDHSVNVNKFLSQRAYGNRTPKLPSDFGLQHLISNGLLRENQINLGTIDKVYTSCWLDDDSILVGTKCSKLILIDLKTRKHHHLPVVQSKRPSTKIGGIYSIATNPSRTLLTTGTTDGNDLAVYGLPSLDIQFRLEKGHKDLIFDTVWLNDQFLLSSSRDSTLSLWGVVDEYPIVDPRTDLYVMETREPWIQFNFEEIDSIRCMKFMRTKNELSVLASNCKLHSIDALTMTTNKRCSLTYGSDLCCLAQNEENLYAVGSNSHIQLVDSRTFSIVSTINSRNPDCRIRSMSFNSDILTITTGIGDILFYDVRNSRYFQDRATKELVLLKASKGWNRPNQEHLNLNYGYFSSHPDLPAIYTHAYDESKMRLFTAGGPLQANMAGNYCSVWS